MAVLLDLINFKFQLNRERNFHQLHKFTQQNHSIWLDSTQSKNWFGWGWFNGLFWFRLTKKLLLFNWITMEISKFKMSKHALSDYSILFKWFWFGVTFFSLPWICVFDVFWLVISMTIISFDLNNGF